MKNILLVAIAIFLFSCGETNKNNNDDKVTEQTTETEQVESEIDKAKDEQNSIIAAYTSFEWDNFYYYTFTTESGKKYVFKGMPDGIDYKFVYQDANNPGGIEEPELLGKKFEIQFHSEKSDGENGGLVKDYFIVDKIKMIDNEESTVTTEPIYEKFIDESPKTTNGDVSNIIEEYNEIIKGEGYTVEKPSVERMFTEVVLKKKNGKIKMIEIIESDSRYENISQYFYKNNKLFYVYLNYSNSDETDEEGMRVFKTIENKYYFADGKCILFLFSNSEQNKEYPEYESIGSAILKTSKTGNEFQQWTEANKWNEF